MKALKVVVVAAACVIWMSGFLLAAEKQAMEPVKAPSIEVPQETYEFNKIVEGQEVLHDFKIRNSGQGQLEILKVKPG